MKKLLAFFLLLLVGTISIFAQEVEPPTEVWEIFTNIRAFLGSIYGAFALLVFLAPLVIGALKLEDKVMKYLFTILVAGGIVLACFFVEFGYLYGSHWISIPLNILGLVLVQTGVFAIPFVKDVLEAIEEKFRKD